MRRHAPGFAILLLMLAIASLLTLGFFIQTRLAHIERQQRSDDRRLQALWLARSAALQGRNVSIEVAVAGDDAHIECRKIDGQWTATARFPRFGTATVAMTLDARGKPVASTERYEAIDPTRIESGRDAAPEYVKTKE